MKYYVDGFVFGDNPSMKGGGYLVMAEDGSIKACKKIIRPFFTNNEAELRALICGLELAEDGDTIITDSVNSLRWVRSNKCKGRRDLYDWVRYARYLWESKAVRLLWVGRNENIAGIEIERLQDANELEGYATEVRPVLGEIPKEGSEEGRAEGVGEGTNGRLPL